VAWQFVSAQARLRRLLLLLLLRRVQSAMLSVSLEAGAAVWLDEAGSSVAARTHTPLPRTNPPLPLVEFGVAVTGMRVWHAPCHFWIAILAVNATNAFNQCKCPQQVKC
jgi:hypothetical protein